MTNEVQQAAEAAGWVIVNEDPRLADADPYDISLAHHFAVKGYQKAIAEAVSPTKRIRCAMIAEENKWLRKAIRAMRVGKLSRYYTMKYLKRANAIEDYMVGR